MIFVVRWDLQFSTQEKKERDNDKKVAEAKNEHCQCSKKEKN